MLALVFLSDSCVYEIDRVEAVVMKHRYVDLNSDVGEHSERESDARLMSSISSANIACGYHGGDSFSMRETVRHAIDNGVAIGAHPGFADPEGFGRRSIDVSPVEVEVLVLDQIKKLAEIAIIEGGQLDHVKPHGALYHMASERREIADAVVRAVMVVDDKLVLFGMSGSSLLAAGQAAGLNIASEVFADRQYRSPAALVPRESPDALVIDARQVVDRAVKMVLTGTVSCVDGVLAKVQADTICVHGDTPGAVELASSVKVGLEAHGIVVAAPAHEPSPPVETPDRPSYRDSTDKGS